MYRFIFVLAGWLLANGISAQVLSFDLCADQLLAEFLEKEDFSAASRLSRDKRFSMHADFFRDVPVQHKSLEKILCRKPKLVVALDNFPALFHKHLKQQGVRILVLKTPKNCTDLKKVWHQLGQVLNKQERARVLCEKLDQLFLKEQDIKEQVLILGKGNLSFGGDIFWTDLLERLNRRNRLAEKKGWFYITGEKLIALKPKKIIRFSDQKNLGDLFSLGGSPDVLVLPEKIMMCPCLRAAETICKSLKCQK